MVRGTGVDGRDRRERGRARARRQRAGVPGVPGCPGPVGVRPVAAVAGPGREATVAATPTIVIDERVLSHAVPVEAECPCWCADRTTRAMRTRARRRLPSRGLTRILESATKSVDSPRRAKGTAVPKARQIFARRRTGSPRRPASARRWRGHDQRSAISYLTLRRRSGTANSAARRPSVVRHTISSRNGRTVRITRKSFCRFHSAARTAPVSFRVSYESGVTRGIRQRLILGHSVNLGL